MNHKPFFTIITASFNNAGSIRNTLDSVAAQTFQSLEHIVIDGGSTDETAFLLKSYESKYNLKWISEPDDGIADAMNKGVRQAQGEYIIFIHSDDTLYRNDSLLTAYEIIKDSFHSIYSFRIEHRFSEYQKKVINPPGSCGGPDLETTFPTRVSLSMKAFSKRPDFSTRTTRSVWITTIFTGHLMMGLPLKQSVKLFPLWEAAGSAVMKK